VILVEEGKQILKAYYTPLILFKLETNYDIVMLL